MQITKTIWLSIALFCITFKFFCGAQELPQGSYQQSCYGCYLVGDALECETCLASHGAGLFSRFENPLDCSGDISNNEGTLECLGQMVPRSSDAAGQPTQHVDPQRIAHIQSAAQHLLDSIHALENKATGVRALQPAIATWQHVLDKLKGAAFGVRDHYAPIMARQQFSGFYDQFLAMAKRFRQLVDPLAFQEYDLDSGYEAESNASPIASPNASPTASGTAATVGFLAALDRSHLFKNIEKIQQIYDKETKIIREKQLAQEEVARQQQQEHEVAPSDSWEYDQNFFNGDYLAY